MKPRAKWLNDELMGTKPGRHQNKKRRHEVTEQKLAAKQYKLTKRQVYEQDLSSDSD